MADGGATKRDSALRTVAVALGVSLVCSIVVATAAVALRPLQQKNRLENQQRVILEVAGLYRADESIATQFARVDARLVDLETGRYVEDRSALDFDAKLAARDPQTSVAIPASEDIARLGRRATLAPVYLGRDGDRLTRVVLPVSGAGLWSRLYGYIALESDANTVFALRFYEHAETPGLGDQIDKPAWLAQWPGKQIYDEQGEPAITVVKGQASDTMPAAALQVDGLSGATLTGDGVNGLLHYWLGDDGFGPYLERIRDGG